MGIFEALQLFRTPLQLVQRMQPFEGEDQRAKAAWQQLREAEAVVQSYEAYQDLRVEEGHGLALTALDLYDTGSKKEDEHHPASVTGVIGL